MSIRFLFIFLLTSSGDLAGMNLQCLLVLNSLFVDALGIGLTALPGFSGGCTLKNHEPWLKPPNFGHFFIIR